jgi:hypothetical protein
MDRQKEKYFAYLDTLRASGAVNMFGSAVYLAKEFNLTMLVARSIVSEWMMQIAE